MTSKILQLVLTNTTANDIVVWVSEEDANYLLNIFYEEMPNFFEIDGTDGERVVIDSSYIAGMVVRNDDET